LNMLRQPYQPVTRFIADAMLGRLARWLRILGYDTAYEKIISDNVLIERVLAENRWLLTRDGYLAQRKVLCGRHTLIKSDSLDDQLRQLRDELSLRLHVLDLGEERQFRCADCNLLLHHISAEEASGLVPPFVARQYHEFLQCDSCRRIYWPGTHWEALTGRLALIRKGETSADR
jgi:uncharacterized protein